jgi:hypothetical protein
MSKADKVATVILEKWTAELKDKDRSRANVSSNFDDLFNALFNADIDFDTAHEIIETAAKAHYPSDFIARKTYDATEKRKGADKKSYQEFIDGWKKDIKETAVQSFYAFYDGQSPKEEPQFGKMSAREYRAQRKYAESFPIITFEEIQQRMKQLEVDLTQPLDVDLGEKDE